MTDVYIIDELTGEPWNFVYGVASKHSKSGVFSFARYDSDFWSGEEPKSFEEKDWETILYRAVKVMVHEIGHLFGVKHCVYFNCLMNGSNNEEENNSKP